MAGEREVTEPLEAPPLFGDDDIWASAPPTDDVPPEPADTAVEETADDRVGWFGSKWLESYVVPVSSLILDGAEPSAGDLDASARGLGEVGQVNPVLVADDGVTVVYRDWIVRAANRLGWNGVAVRSEKAELAEREQEQNQTSLLQEAEMTGVAIDGFEREEAEVDADLLNEKSMEERPDWVGLPEFVPATDAEKLVISCKTKEDRDAALDALGIRTIHKGTRGTLSVWFPDKERRDLSSLRFVDLFKEEESGH